MLSVTTNLGDEKHRNFGLESVSDDAMERALKYLAMGYSAQRVSELFGIRITVARLMKASIK